jgi:hypothetical protein
MPLLVIVGAGASYDSDVAHAPLRPGEVAGTKYYEFHGNRLPLAKDLFDERFGPELKAHPQFAGQIQRLRDAGNQVEQELEHIAARAQADPTVVRELMAVRYYLRDVIRGSQDKWNNLTFGADNYATLLGRIRAWQRDTDPVYFVTFNYDTLLENAFRHVLDVPIHDLPSYIAHASYKLVKPHGSVSWWHRAVEVGDSLVAFDNTAPRIIGAAAAPAGPYHLTWTEEYVESINPPSQHRQSHEAWFPAIAIPTQTKTTFECPPDHLSVLDDAFPTFTHVLIVGWRATEQHFLKRWHDAALASDMYKQELASSYRMIVDTEVGAKAVEDNLAAARIGAWRAFAFTEGLSAFLHDETKLNEFLSQS